MRLRIASSQALHPSFCPFGAKAQLRRCSSLPHQTHFVGLWRGPHFALFPRTRLYCNMCDKNVGTERKTGLICSRKLGGCVSLSPESACFAARSSSAESRSASGQTSSVRSDTKQVSSRRKSCCKSVKKPPPSQHSVRLLQLSILLLCDQFGVPKRLQQLV